METALVQNGSQSSDGGECELVEKYLMEMVKKKRLKVERLERELDALRKHCVKIFESFSIPTFPEGYDLDSKRLGDEDVNDSIRPSHAAARGLKKRQSPSSKTRNEAELADERDIIEEAIPKRAVKIPIPSKILSSSKSASSSKSVSSSMEARNVMGLTNDYENDIDVMKDEIRRVRPGVKSPRKSPAKPNGISTRHVSGFKILEKMLKTGYGVNDDRESSDEGSSSESSDDESPSESSDEDVVPVESSDEESHSESFDEESPLEVSDEESSGNEGGESTSEDSDESDEPQNESRKVKPSSSDPEEVSAQRISPDITSDSLTEKKSSPVKMSSGFSGEIAKTAGMPTTKAPSSSSEESEGSSSSSDEDTSRSRHYAQTGRAKRSPEVPKAVATTILSPDASPEDLFDWTILGLQGPWLPLASVENSSGGLGLKDQSLPLKFPSIRAYTATFQKLIGEEAKATLSCEWDRFKAEQDSNTEQTLNVDSRGLSSIWRLRKMVRTTGDPFYYFEAESKQGNFIKFDIGEFLCMVVPGTVEVKGVAIVNYQDRLQAPLLRSRVPGDFSLDECVLLRLCNMVTLRRMFLAVSTLSDICSPLQQQILNPLANIKFTKPPPALKDLVDGDPKLKLNSEILRNFNDRHILNTQQLMAVSNLLHMRQGFQLIQGPPGTGKFLTPSGCVDIIDPTDIYYRWPWYAAVLGMVSTLLTEEPGARILVCAPSNAALDEMAARLMHRMLDKSGNIYSPIDGSIIRFGSQKVIHPIVQLISLDSLTVRLSSSSNRSRAWVDILDGASVVCATLSGCGSHTFDELEKMFDVVIIDEAAQAVEAEVLIALKRAKGRCVMVGDPQQLPATVFQRPDVAYGRSLFERLQEGGNPVHMLTTQYRMHPNICIYPSKQFYGGALKNSERTSTMKSIFSEQVCERGITVRGCRFKLGHYCFMDVGWGFDREEVVGHSRANYEEALVVCNVVEGAVKGLLPGCKPNVGVITPYIAQRGVIESQLERRGIDTAACEVNTVDGFQGREKDVIVLSCVRAMADQGLGFVSDLRRMNVALTRAKYSLIIVGHATTLRKWSPAWDALIEDARKRGCYQVLKNNKNQDNSASNRNQSSYLRKDPNGTVEVENTPQGSRKRSLNNTEGGLPNKEYSKPTKADRKSNKNVNDEDDVGEARKGEEHAQKSSRNSKTPGVEEKAVRKTKVKRKWESLEPEGERKNSEGGAPNSASAEKLIASEDMLNETANSPDLVVPPKKKKKRKQVKEPPNSRKKKDKVEPSAAKGSPVLQEKRVKVELEEDEPSVSKTTPIMFKEVKQEFSSVEQRKLKPVIALQAPSLTPASKRKGKQPAATSAHQSNGESEILPKSSTERNKVPPEIVSVKREEIMREVTSSAPGGGHTWRTFLDSNDNGKSHTADPIPEGANNWRSSGTEDRSRGWFPNPVSEDDRHLPHIRKPVQRNAHSSSATNPTPQVFPNFNEYPVERRQPHWGNSYEVATDPHNFRAHDFDRSIDNNMFSVLTRPNNHSGMHLQQGPRNQWQHPTNTAQTPPPHGHQPNGRQFANVGHSSQRLPHSAPPPPRRNKRTWPGKSPYWRPRPSHPGKSSNRQGHRKG